MVRTNSQYTARNGSKQGHMRSDVGVIGNFLSLGNEQYLFLVNIKFGA